MVFTYDLVANTSATIASILMEIGTEMRRKGVIGMIFYEWRAQGNLFIARETIVHSFHFIFSIIMINIYSLPSMIKLSLVCILISSFTLSLPVASSPLENTSPSPPVNTAGDIVSTASTTASEDANLGIAKDIPSIPDVTKSERNELIYKAWESRLKGDNLNSVKAISDFFLQCFSPSSTATDTSVIDHNKCSTADKGAAMALLAQIAEEPDRITSILNGNKQDISRQSLSTLMNRVRTWISNHPLLSSSATAVGSASISKGNEKSNENQQFTQKNQHQQSDVSKSNDPAFISDVIQKVFYLLGSSMSDTKVKRDHQLAASLWNEAATLGNETAHFRLGVLYSIGTLGFPHDVKKSMIHHYLAAVGGHIGSQMALGYRYRAGIDVAKSCPTAFSYYEGPARQATEYFEREGVEPLVVREKISLAGKRNQRGYGNQDIVDFYQQSADKGDMNSQIALAEIFYYGARGVDRNLRLAARYFILAAAQGDPTARTYIASLHVRGVGVPQDYKAAFGNYTLALSGNQKGKFSEDDGTSDYPAALNGLGYLYLYGLGVEQDGNKALKYFHRAADQGNHEALYNLGALYLSGEGAQARDFVKAYNYLRIATNKGNILAMHKLAYMSFLGLGIVKDCSQAVDLMKVIAERGPFGLERNSYSALLHEKGNYQSAFHSYTVLADIGYESAQMNAASLLDYYSVVDFEYNYTSPSAKDVINAISSESDKQSKELNDNTEKKEEVTTTTKPSSEKDNSNKQSELMPVSGTLLSRSLDSIGRIASVLGIKLPKITRSIEALKFYAWAAKQGNIESRVRMGDYMFFGIPGLLHPDYEKATSFYRYASDARDPEGMWNLAYAYQFGLGLRSNDYFLAKRYYDMCAETNPDATAPVRLALIVLRIQQAYDAIFHGGSTVGLPAFIITLKNWIGNHSITTDQMKQQEKLATPSGTIPSHPSSASTSLSFDILSSMIFDLETDTIILVLLGLILIFITYYRNQRLSMRRRIALEQFHQQQQQQQQ